MPAKPLFWTAPVVGQWMALSSQHGAPNTGALVWRLTLGGGVYTVYNSDRELLAEGDLARRWSDLTHAQKWCQDREDAMDGPTVPQSPGPTVPGSSPSDNPPMAPGPGGGSVPDAGPGSTERRYNAGSGSPDAVHPASVGVNVTLFCRVMKLLGRRHPKRTLDQASLNRLIGMVGDLDRTYSALPVWQKGAGK
jgi:hypothetical protein